MKKLAILISLAIAAPVFACPGMDHEKSTATAKSDKTDKAPAKTEQPKQDTAKATAKDSKDTAKKPDKVSAK
jgi:hypothetical protein